MLLSEATEGLRIMKQESEGSFCSYGLNINCRKTKDMVSEGITQVRITGWFVYN